MINQIRDIFLTRGDRQYDGEAVTQLEHALQCAYLAEQAGEKPEMIAACLFHDFGHLLEGNTPHEYRALQILGNLFQPEIIEPIRLHVEAKRYLCFVDPQYYSSLSRASQASLLTQGGIFTQKNAKKFQALPYAEAAIQLRRWDEQAKIPGLPTPDLLHFLTK
ncbi:HD domain-containing protein [Gloeocapsa sp. PCC 73106]|uniref:HD domain-containing protein n=1 Tax=Gloeocapsa sp. PCC 73106 TaxID=102232 RepID=UPI0002ACBAE8|nr:HD domain-containing protein [Gloeocapsa sp. PCC 73106]ELS00299.1 putative HD phosphohydrolase [Gloeocapsa sp. PCC 73106]